MANLQIRVDDTVRDRAREVAAGMGMDLGEAVRIFLSQMIREKGLPFRPSAEKFCSQENRAYLKKAAAERDADVNVHARELIED